MRIAFVTNKRTPYRALQLNEFSTIKDVEITTYYTHKRHENRNWKLNENNNFKEVDLKGIKINRTYGYLNKGIINIVIKNDLIIIGGYEQPTYILISMLCRLFNKPYIISYDGISTDRLEKKENGIKAKIKQIVISNSKYILGNGTVSKKYFNESFGYPLEKIYNQYLTVDSDKIKRLYENKETYRNEYRKKLGIDKNEKVLIYSGRLVDIKNVDSVIKAISKLDKNDLTFLITGGGELEEELKKLSDSLGVKTIITGFISNQEELFKHYFIGDALILPSSVYEVWGLVVNEGMLCGLPVLVSNICGCSLDLVKNNKNGYIINPLELNDISEKIFEILYNRDHIEMGKESLKIMNNWTIANATNEFKALIKELSDIV